MCPGVQGIAVSPQAEVQTVGIYALWTAAETMQRRSPGEAGRSVMVFFSINSLCKVLPDPHRRDTLIACPYAGPREPFSGTQGGVFAAKNGGYRHAPLRSLMLAEQLPQAPSNGFAAVQDMVRPILCCVLWLLCQIHCIVACICVHDRHCEAQIISQSPSVCFPFSTICRPFTLPRFILQTLSQTPAELGDAHFATVLRRLAATAWDSQPRHQRASLQPWPVALPSQECLAPDGRPRCLRGPQSLCACLASSQGWGWAAGAPHLECLQGQTSHED